ncbi:DUF5658 family protein [Mesobacillus selenatarsenatis]|uniref:DUF5658 family protein n=1 Tax=Mesobacillus selenatarsenatis TaxID=388741 RepID=UPI0005AB87A3|nr:DUF5658 family protein [Mesobacillus selenatarsenatis]
MTLLFYYLAILNLLDGAVTWFGLKYALISELNPLMHAIYEINPLVFISTKAALSIFLLLFILLKKVPRSFLIKGLTVFASVSYTAVFCLHSFWLIQLA